MKRYNDDLQDKIFEKLISNIFSEIQSTYQRDSWIDVETHFYSTDGQKDILIKREGEYIQYFLSEIELCIHLFAEIYGIKKIQFEINKEEILSFEKMYKEFNHKFFDDWHSFVRKMKIK